MIKTIILLLLSIISATVVSIIVELVCRHVFDISERGLGWGAGYFAALTLIVINFKLEPR